jgi:hypothetical protein
VQWHGYDDVDGVRTDGGGLRHKPTGRDLANGDVAEAGAESDTTGDVGGLKDGRARCGG